MRDCQGVIAADECHLKGLACLQQRQIRRAAEHFQEALDLGIDPLPGVAERWSTWMLLGEFERAWQESDRIECLRRRGFPVEGQLVWDGRGFDRKKVLLRNDHGLGDTVQFIRYAPLLKGRCSRLIVKAQPILAPLLQTFGCIDEIVSTEQPDPHFDVQMESNELPYVFRTTLETIPSTVPYIRLKEPRERAARSEQLQVGLVWASGPWNRSRSLRLADFRPLGGIANVVFRSLQWGPEHIEARSADHGLPMQHESVSIREDIIATAQRILQCDLVVTVDTMVAHLAGALARPVWVLLHFDSDWRWMIERSDSPWYPTMKLFRQTSRGDWSGPVDAVARELERWMS